MGGSVRDGVGTWLTFSHDLAQVVQHERERCPLHHSPAWRIEQHLNLGA